MPNKAQSNYFIICPFNQIYRGIIKVYLSQFQETNISLRNNSLRNNIRPRFSVNAEKIKIAVFEFYHNSGQNVFSNSRESISTPIVFIKMEFAHMAEKKGIQALK